MGLLWGRALAWTAAFNAHNPVSLFTVSEFVQADFTYFVDVSCFRDYLGNHAGYAVVKQQGGDFVTVKAQCDMRMTSHAVVGAALGGM